MMSIQAILILIMLSCATLINSNYYNTEIQLEIRVIEGNILLLTFANTSPHKIELSDPLCYINSVIIVTKNGVAVDKLLKIKPDVHCIQKMVSIDANDLKEFLYPYKLDEMFDLRSGEEYEIKFAYEGQILGHAERILTENTVFKCL
jgi:hypothetical protein